MHKKFLVFLGFLTLVFQFNQSSFAQQKRRTVRKKPVTVTAQTYIEIPDTNLSPEQKRRLETFRLVWNTIHENYFDQTFNNLNWLKIKQEYEPRVVKLTTDRELHALLQELINLLNRSHFAIISPEVINAIENAKVKAKTEASGMEKNETDEEDADSEIDETEEDSDDYDTKFGIGADLRILNNQFLITRVEKDSAAEKAGLKTGYVIEKINDVSLVDLLKRVEASGANSKSVLKKLPLEIVTFFLNGEKDVPVKITFADENEQQKEISIERRRLHGELVKLLPNLPKQFLNFEVKSVNEDVGLIKFNFFAVSIIEKFCSALTQLKDKKAIIIDLRGNMGGTIGAVWGISGMLTDKVIPLGTEINKYGREVQLIRPQPKNYKGKIVILIDGLSHSAAEIFAAAMQENNRAFVIGEKSAGEALPAITMPLPTGAVFLYPISNFETPKGNLIEGKGVSPNLIVSLDKQTLLAEKDKQFDAAINYLKTEFSKPENKIAKTGILVENSRSQNPPTSSKPSSIKPISGSEAKQDEKALSIFNDFLNVIGGENALKNINSYSASGTAVLNRSGAKIYGGIKIFKQTPDKTAEIYNFDGIGEIVEAFNGKEFFVQSPFTGIEKEDSPDFVAEKSLQSDFYELTNVKKNYPKLTFMGEFERDGRKVNLVEAKTKGGVVTVFAFDVESKLLVHRTGNLGDIAYDDYRKAGDILFPFTQTRGSTFLLKFDEVKFNEKIDDAVFIAHESCFEKTN